MARNIARRCEIIGCLSAARLNPLRLGELEFSGSSTLRSEGKPAKITEIASLDTNSNVPRWRVGQNPLESSLFGAFVLNGYRRCPIPEVRPPVAALDDSGSGEAGAHVDGAQCPATCVFAL